MKHLIENAFDMHVHSGPDVLNRKMDDIDLAKRMADAGMSGYIIKSHYFNTAERATLVRKLHPGVNAAGALSLNGAVGGINPVAVQLAAMSGAKLVWFPTTDAKHEQDAMFGPNAVPPKKPPFWANIVMELKAQNISCPPVTVFDENGKISSATRDVLDIAAKKEMVVATGHLSHEETFALVRAAKEQNVGRILVTHVTFPSTFYTVPEQKELIALGAYVEHCYTTYATGKVEFDVIADQIKGVGCDRVVLATDLGQPAAVFPDEGLLDFSKRLVEKGFSEKDVRMMNGDTPRMLTGVN